MHNKWHALKIQVDINGAAPGDLLRLVCEPFTILIKEQLSVGRGNMMPLLGAMPVLVVVESNSQRAPTVILCSLEYNSFYDPLMPVL
jgi:hypothetical protein